jgi:uncharacterized membrane protein YgaE (UPF0421/DUF939 family)
MTIGARVIKTGLAVAVTLWVGVLVGLDAPLIAAIAAIFTIQPSIYRSWKEVLQQVQSNLLGAAVAIAAVTLIGKSPLAVGLVCIGVILLCIRLKAEETIGLTLVTVVVIMEAQGQGWMVAADRLGGILTGMVSAFAVNVLIAPPKHQQRFVKHIQDAQELLSRLLRTAVSNELKENVFRQEEKRLKAMLRQLDEFYDLFAEERVWRRNARVQRMRLLVVYKGMLSALERGVTLIEAVEDHYFAVSSAEAWNRLIDRQIEALCGYHEQLLWKWGGKMKAGATAAAPQAEVSMLLSELIADQTKGDSTTRARLLVITSSLYNYDETLRRLNKLMEHWLERVESGDSAADEA